MRFEESEIRNPKSEIRRRSSRRGVLLLVVLSLLVLFMLIGTAFLMSSNQFSRASKASAKLNRVGNYPTKLLDRAVMQIVRDTDNPSSVVRYHSLLRDLYGTEGFEGVVYSPLDADFDPTDTTFVGRNTRFAAAAPGSDPMLIEQVELGPTQGQIIDLYVRALGYSARAPNNPSADDPLTPDVDERAQILFPDVRHVVKLERDVTQESQLHVLPLTRGYYNGCLLTVTSGPAAGQSTRILDYEYVADILPTATPGGGYPEAPSRLFRFRVLAFPRSDGSPLEIDQAARSPEIVDLAGATFIVNGRPLNGTGAGYNPFSIAGQPRLTARESIRLGNPAAPPVLSDVLYPEIALTPNSAYFVPYDPRPPLVYASPNDDFTNLNFWGPRYFNEAANRYDPLNLKSTAVTDRAMLWNYPSFIGPGDADESYDAADFQNMFLALQTVTPRAQGRVVQVDDTNSPPDADSAPDVLDISDPDIDPRYFLRLDLEDLPLPSFHRPALINFWYHRLVNYAANPTGGAASPRDDHVRAVLQPYGPDGIREGSPGDSGDDPTVVDLAVRDQIVAVKRKISLRPLREDHPDFDGSNPQSRPADLSGVAPLVINGNITIPYWEAVGPWDVDNDNDGVPDSVWVDLGEPVAQAEDGTLYKPMFAFLIQDLDSRLNVNAHGLVDDLTLPNLDFTTLTTGVGNLANDVNVPNLPFNSELGSSNSLPHGVGYGPAEISLRPILSPMLPSMAAAGVVPATNFGDPGFNNLLNADDYARLLVGRPKTDPTLPPPAPQWLSVWGRHGLVDIFGAPLNIFNVQPGMTFNNTAAAATSDALASLQFFGYPSWLSYYYSDRLASPYPTVPTAFGSPPDLFGRYAVGLDYTGQPVYEQAADFVATVLSGGTDRSLLVDSPYELNLADSARRDVPDPSAAATMVNLAGSGGYVDFNDDAPFATADLERILRSYDADAGILPDRLWNVVDAFDPVKLVRNQPDMVVTFARQMFNDTSINTGDEAKMLAAAQSMAGPARRLVTTDSYDLPVPAGNFLSRLICGADGQPGVAGQDDDGANGVDDPGELGWGGSDDYYPVMNGVTVPGPPPADAKLTPESSTIVDLLKYRVQYERLKLGFPIYGEVELSQAAQFLLPPEVIAGGKMDLNRPFGDGRDNGDGIDNDGINGIDDPGEMNYPIGDSKRDPYMNGVVDDPLEAGEPFVDRVTVVGATTANVLNGKFDPSGDLFLPVFDLDGNGQYTPPIDTLWQGLTAEEPVTFDYNHGGGLSDRNNDGDYVDDLEGVADGRLYDGNGDGDYDDPGIDGRLRRNGIIQRQTMARHLYCLMMLLVDENYIASQNFRPELLNEGGVYDISFLNENGNFDIFVLHQQLALDIALRNLRELDLLDETTDTTTDAFKTLLGAAVNGEPFNDFNSDGIVDPGEFDPLNANQDVIDNDVHDPGTKATAYAWVLRKLTARRIAQWAINCVDYRDADSIMTPFEYDENPFDGWGVYATDYSRPAGDRQVFVPLDGDVATNENWGLDSAAPFLAPRKFDPYRRIVNNPADPEYNPRNDAEPALVGGTREAATREVVWGAERPELLITETLALHDRRATDESDPSGYPPHRSIMDPPSSSGAEPPDFDLDQKLKPRGSLFVELYNPWSPDAEKPAEVYGRVGDIDANTPGTQLSDSGVMLNRLSTLGYRDPATGLLKYSPVWRMAVLYDPFTGKLTSKVINPSLPTALEDAAKQVLSTDPDGFAIEMDKHSERLVYFTTGGDVNRQDDNDFATNLPDGLAEYQQIGTRYEPEADQLTVRVPALPVRFVQRPGSTNIEPLPAARRYFVARTERWISGAANDLDVPIAPILPGRYAVVGSSGLQLYDDPNQSIQASGKSTLVALDNDVTTRFVTPISRLLGSDIDEQTNDAHHRQLFQTRRIELWPSINPNRQQLLIGENGGPEFVRTNTGIVNVSDSEQPAATSSGDPLRFGVPDNSIIEPCVAIPIEDLNISEPVEGYPSLLYQKLYIANNPNAPALDAPAEVKINAEGEIEFTPSYDRPLDIEEATTKNGTTPNYRTLHLQRLANPLLPWNPPPYDKNGQENAFHRAELPINPYLTIDSQSVDLTAYNGASQFERTRLPVDNGPAGTTEDVWQGDFFAPLTPDELADAPDHVLWALIFILKQQQANQPPIIPKEKWVTPADIRGQILNQPDRVEQYLDQLATQKGINTRDSGFRQAILQTPRPQAPLPPGTPQPYSRDGIWGAHLFRRVLPDDAASDNSKTTGSFYQWLHMKSLERGAHDSVYTLNPLGWSYDPNWEPRLLWQQVRPNTRLFILGGPTGRIEASDLRHSKSKRVLEGGESLEQLHNLGLDPLDETNRNRAVWAKLKAGTVVGSNEHVVDFVLEQTLGFANESYAPELDRTGGDKNALLGLNSPKPGAPEVAAANSNNLPVDPVDPNEVTASPRRPSVYTSAEANVVGDHRRRLMRSTYPWLAWNDRPFVSADEIMQVPAWSSSLMLHEYSVINRYTANPYDGGFIVDDGSLVANGNGVRVSTLRYNREQAPFGHLLNYFSTSHLPAETTTSPISYFGAPNYYRILDYIEVRSRYVGTDDLLTAEFFNDVPGVIDGVAPNTVGTDIAGPLDPRINFQPPFNNVSRERDPGRVNLNTVVGRRVMDSNGVPRIWSDVYDGIMHRSQVYDPGPSPPGTARLIAGDGNLVDSSGSLLQLSHFGPAWRDVVLSRKGFAQFNADDPGLDNPVEKPTPGAAPDVFTFGLNPGFPTLFANPFRSPNAGDLVPLVQMQQYGVDASLLRVHPRYRGNRIDDDGNGINDDEPDARAWGFYNVDDDGNGLVDDIRDAGYGDDVVSHRGRDPGEYRAVPKERFSDDDRESLPLFSESLPDAAIDASRNPAMMYEPMTRLGNLVTTRSNVFAVWVTVGYFEVEPAPDWRDSDVRERFGATTDDDDPQTIYGRALYDRVYPEGYMLGQEVGSDTGNTKRQRAFYIIDRTEPVGFKPGEDLNVERAIRVRRRID